MSASGNEWTLDLVTEASILLPFYLGEPDPAVRQAVERFIDRLIESPVGRGVEERPGVYSAHVEKPASSLCGCSTSGKRSIVLAIVGRDEPGP